MIPQQSVILVSDSWKSDVATAVSANIDPSKAVAFHKKEEYNDDDDAKSLHFSDIGIVDNARQHDNIRAEPCAVNCGGNKLEAFLLCKILVVGTMERLLSSC